MVRRATCGRKGTQERRTSSEGEESNNRIVLVRSRQTEELREDVHGTNAWLGGD